MPKDIISLFYVLKFAKKNSAKSFADRVSINIKIEKLDKNLKTD